MIRLPVLRAGQPYESLTVEPLRHFASADKVADLSLANSGLIARDLDSIGECRRRLSHLSTEDLIAICSRAADHFLEGELLMGEERLGPAPYIALQSSTTGMPQTLCASNMQKIAHTLKEMRSVLSGLTRGLDLEILDRGYGSQDQQLVSYRRECECLGAVLPSNSPGVHALWLPAIALKVPVVLKPGRQEPWTPYRIARAMVEAGCPAEAISIYPSDHSGASEILLRCGKSMLFGDQATVAPWRHDPRVQIHGPGWSKVLLFDDSLDRWPEWIDLAFESAVSNGGRSCINASGVWVSGRGREIAEALAQKCASVEARALDHPEAQLAAFGNKVVARRLSARIDQLLEVPGAVDLTQQVRREGRFVEIDDAAFLLPTVIWCDDPGHPLAHSEFLFPFVSVVELSEDELLEKIGPTLVATALTEDPHTKEKLLSCRHIERLNLGPIPTQKIAWNQPHEGNLFEHLFRQRALQSAAPAMA